MYADRVVLVIAVVATSVVALPNHLKAVVVDSDPIPKVPTVSASFGGYSAKAGLGGSGTSGGLFASADSPFGSAGAGLGGSVNGDSPSGGLGASASTGGLGASASSGSSTGVSSGAGGHAHASSGSLGGTNTHASAGHNGAHAQAGTAGHKPFVNQGPGLFDNIFNIPISVLQAVNTYLNNREPIRKPIHRRRGHQPPVVYKTVTPDHSVPNKPSNEAAADTTAQSEAGTISGAQGPVVLQKRVNYDEIFNIPISALKSVNQLLNNGKK